MDPNYQQPMEFAQWEAMTRKAYQLQGQEEKEHSERITHLCVQFEDERNTPLWKSSKGGPHRYLYRVSCPNSHATNKQWAKSQAAEDRLESAKVDIFARRSSEKDRLEAAEDINDHLRSKLWWKRPRVDNLVSWTNSLLVALRYMWYRHQRDELQLYNINLIVLDRERLEGGSITQPMLTNLPRTFTRDLDLMEEFKDYNEELKELYDMRENRGYDFGEYLSQGALKIEGRCAMVSAQDLVDNGLLDIRPDLPAGSDQDWTDSVLRLRQNFSGPHTTRFQYTAAQKEAINKIADLFESEFWLPMALAFMTVLPCRLQGFGLDGIIEDDKLRHLSTTRHRIITAKNPEDYDPMHDAVVQLSVSDTRSFSSLEPEQLKYIKSSASLPEVQQFEWLAYNYSGYLNLLLTRGSLVEAEDELKQSRAFSAWLWERGGPVVLPSFHKLRHETKALAFSARTMSNNLWKEL